MEKSNSNRWIIQKNVSSAQQILDYAKSINECSNEINYDTLVKNLNSAGNSNITSESTLGVRMSQLAFYMIGYKSNNTFVPSIITQKYFNNEIDKDIYGLLSLFSMQYPHPFSETPPNFNIYIGRFILKLLSDIRLSCKLYIDEIIWFLPFVQEISTQNYEGIITKILEYRNLTYMDKQIRFHNIVGYEEIFSNVTHEFNYYFLRIFEGFGVFDLIGDEKYDGGSVFRFKHGNTETYRNTAYKSRARYGGYVQISQKLRDKVSKLLSRFSPFTKPETQATALSKEFWLKDLYEFKMLDYLAEIIDIDPVDIKVKEMIRLSVEGSNDGKDFEQAVKDVMDLFEDVPYTEIISGAGDTDILCVFRNNDESFKFNVDSKKSKKSLSSINPVRITNHLKKNQSRYAIIVTSRFSKGANSDISNYEIVNLDAETLGRYMLKSSNSGRHLEFLGINNIVEGNLGTNISQRVDFLAESLFNK
mgnify:CR=1 FL=1